MLVCAVCPWYSVGLVNAALSVHWMNAPQAAIPSFFVGPSWDWAKDFYFLLRYQSKYFIVWMGFDLRSKRKEKKGFVMSYSGGNISYSDPQETATSATTSPTPPEESELKLYQAFIFSVPIFFTFVLLFVFYLFYLRRRGVDWDSLRMRNSSSLPASESDDSSRVLLLYINSEKYFPF